MDLKGLRLDAIPRRLCHSYSAAATLQKLDFSHNRLDVIPSDICLLTSLTELNLAKNHAITTIPADLFKLTQVRSSASLPSPIPPFFYNLTFVL